MATNITTDNLIGQFCSLINTNASGVADVDDLLIYTGHGSTAALQRASDMTPEAIFQKCFQRNTTLDIIMERFA